jgi:hypothetical protein
MNNRNHYNPFRGLKKVKQINNLRIFFDDSVAVNQYKIGTPDNRVLEEFAFQKDAEEFCAKTKDFTVKK